jgi:stress response protein SCP2
MTLANHNVKPNSTIRLLVRLYEVPDQLDDVIFELFWGFPVTGRDYLDATVFLYSGVNFVEMVDYDHRKNSSGSVEHSGDILYLTSEKGQHTINVSLKSLQNRIDTLVFTLSSWNAPSLSHFKNLSLQFFDKKIPEKMLCSDEMGHAADSQAIIMCCLTKRKSVWEVLSLKTLSRGNAKNYEPLKATIANLIEHKL